MSVASDGDGPVVTADRKKRKLENYSTNNDGYKVFQKPLYKRLFPENHSGDCVVYVESTDEEKIGNKNPIILTNLFIENVKGIIGVHRINAHKVGVTFKYPAPANNFLKMDSFLGRYKLKAFIPAYMTEVIGVIRHIPLTMSNEEIYKNITCDADVVSIKRFMKKVDGNLTPLGTVAVTFAATTLPQYVYIKLFRYQVHKYFPPLMQCYRCLRFNHSAKNCRAEQMCSSCAGRHSYKECDVEEIMCVNCSGAHLAVSKDCPVKQKKLEEKKIKQQKMSYANVVSLPQISDSTSFPALTPKPRQKTLQDLNAKQIVDNDLIINALVKSVVALANSKNEPITNKRIKEILLSNLI